jgi:hypothetical protein
MRTWVAAAALGWILGPGGAVAVEEPALSVEKSTDRPGSDYRSFDVGSGGPELCAAACANC